jgi:hypothetical protein
MFTVKIDISDGLPKLGKVSSSLPQNIRDGLMDTGKKILSDAQSNVHVISGRLKGSGRVIAKGDSKINKKER